MSARLTPTWTPRWPSTPRAKTALKIRSNGNALRRSERHRYSLSGGRWTERQRAVDRAVEFAWQRSVDVDAAGGRVFEALPCAALRYARSWSLGSAERTVHDRTADGRRARPDGFAQDRAREFLRRVDGRPDRCCAGCTSCEPSESCRAVQYGGAHRFA